MNELPAGHRLGAYRIRRVAGRGAVGIVYLAEHETEALPVAVKTLSPSYAQEPVFRERFSREAQGAAAVEHPNIITVFDVGEQDGLPYLVMTFVDGPDLERVLSDRGGRIEPAEAVLICASIADALDAAAAQGLAHRDVKPANILLEGWQSDRYGGKARRPHVYLTDFGLIKSSAQARVTQTGQFVGTLLYMAPEQIESRAVPASDQYSLACVLWECLTGTFPFEPTGGSALSLLSAHISNPVPRISERPGTWSAALDRVFHRALAKKPEDRYPTCKDFIDDATRALGLGQAAPSVTPAAPKTAIEHTQIIPTSPPPARGATAGSAAAPTSSRPSPAGPGTSTPPDAQRPPPPAPANAPATPFSQQWPGQPHPSQSIAGTPAAFPSDLGRGGPGGLPGSQRPAPDARSSRGWLVGVVILALLIAAAVAALVLLDGDDGTAAEDPDGSVATAADDDADVGDAPVDDAGTVTPVGSQAVPPAQQGRIAFVGDGDIYTAAADGTEVRNLTGGSVDQPRQPAWQPGADAVLFSSAQGLRLLDVTLAEVQVLTEDPRHSDPAWHPDGSRIAYSTPVDSGGRDLAVLDLDGGPPVLLDVHGAIGVDEPVNALRPAYSPDGDRIAFQADVDGTLQVWTIGADGSAPATAAGIDGAADYHPAWTPDGDLVFSTDRDGIAQVWLHHAGSDDEGALVTADVPVQDADVSPCGDWLAFQLDRSDGRRIGVRSLAGGSLVALPAPEGVADASDPAWRGQPCQT